LSRDGVRRRRSQRSVPVPARNLYPTDEPPPMLAITAFSAGARQERWMEAGRPYGEMHLWSITEDTPHALCILCHLVPDLQRGRSCT
jgi:hypothetical protein